MLAGITTFDTDGTLAWIFEILGFLSIVGIELDTFEVSTSFDDMLGISLTTWLNSCTATWACSISSLAKLIDEPIVISVDCYFLFPDKYVLKGIFSLAETQKSLYDFVKKFLNDEKEEASKIKNK